VTIPLGWINNVGDKVDDKMEDKIKVNKTQRKIIDEMRDNPNVTLPQLMIEIGLGRTAIQNNVTYLRKNGLIERVGSNKTGYWKVKVKQ
jgi:predicted HTH transcriptional regulator